MLRPRIIPCLLVHKGGLVKTAGFKAPKYVGDPINAVKIFNEKEADELIVLDIDASIEKREPNFRLIAQFAAESRMALCYGGGIRTPEQARRIIGLGVEKVAISSVALENPAIVNTIASEIGSQSVVVVLDVKKRGSGSEHEVWIHNGKVNTGRLAHEAAVQFAAAGAGEIVINDIDHDGSMKGYDLTLARRIRQSVKLPVTFLGGCGSLADMGKLISECGVVGAAAGSLFVFKGPYRAVLINYPSQDQRESMIRASLGAAN